MVHVTQFIKILRLIHFNFLSQTLHLSNIMKTVKDHLSILAIIIKNNDYTIMLTKETL